MYRCIKLQTGVIQFRIGTQRSVGGIASSARQTTSRRRSGERSTPARSAFKRIDFGRRARRHVTGKHGQRCQQQRRADEQARIVRADLKGIDKNASHRRKYFCHRERTQKSKNRSDGYQSRTFAQHQPQHLPLARAQRHANSDLPAPLRNRIGRDSGEPDGRQHQRRTRQFRRMCAERTA